MKRSRLKPISDKRRALLREYTPLRKTFLKDNPVCEICHKGRSWDVHHKAGRTGRRLVDTQFWLAVCRNCHDMIHSNSRWAREQGFIV